jgi:hypothetical protein
MTRALSEGGPSESRTTLTAAPLALNPLASAAVNVASPHGVGGYVLKMPKLGEPGNPWRRTGNVDNEGVDRVVKVIPTGGCYLRVRLERLLGAVSGGTADTSRTSWVLNFFDDTPTTFVATAWT